MSTRCIGEISLDSELVLINEHVQDKEEILIKLSDLLHRKGYVKESFSSAVLNREKEFPTGLQTSITGVAIPHTDSEHVLRPALAIATLASPVLFHSMELPENSIRVEIVLMLAVKKAENQLDVLKRVMGILNNKKLLGCLLSADKPEKLTGILANIF